ncbi:MAG: DUF2333 family protein [Candidatus Thiodiazotropha sp.]|nr:DUF2333 family protein [Candidatus Thiodiazotropha taylori]MBT3058473.1 DUF2333 family protein [Candidatus Thiodiazotropha sp. (ex Lucina pensylvanica)]MBT3063388.1 DUF2333 family protein [Candidatus Thiodiazotropha sp. (ex Lucina pensylvanica)]PUB75608.1 MAG: DUF2333 domain-containing protein [gamma proteobacterium symbiont of Ctena orbiculata]
MKALFGKLLRGTTQLINRIARLYHPQTLREKGWIWGSGLGVITLAVMLFLLGLYWSSVPEPFDVRDNTRSMLKEMNLEPVTGSYTTASLISVMETLLEKPGGYLSNDIMPPSVFLDNIPNWEFGALTQARDLARSLRNDMSRSQSQSLENEDLAIAEPQFNYSNDSWIFPSTEGEYRKGLEALRRYLGGLSQQGQESTQFFARADNLRDWLAVVEKRLGSLSQRLSASVGQERINTDLAGDPAAAQSTTTSDHVRVQTPWLEIDDVFYEARGATWALIHFLHAVEIDFQEILRKKNALVSLRQIIRELEATQGPISSPVVLNGSGLGIFANYSLVMASYISRANAAVIDLRNLLSQG